MSNDLLKTVDGLLNQVDALRNEARTLGNALHLMHYAHYSALPASREYREYVKQHLNDHCSHTFHCVCGRLGVTGGGFTKFKPNPLRI
jgi:hypothetical protein